MIVNSVLSVKTSVFGSRVATEVSLAVVFGPPNNPPPPLLRIFFYFFGFYFMKLEILLFFGLVKGFSAIKSENALVI